MPDRTWHFRTVPHQQAGSTTHHWKWRATRPDGWSAESARLFFTLRDCVTDARRHGFTGEVDPGGGSFLQGRYHIQVVDEGGWTLSPIAKHEP